MMTKPLTDQERLNWWRLSRTENIGPITFFRLINRYGSATKALEGLPELARRGGRKNPLVAYPLASAEKEIAALDKIGARVIAACEPDYPELLAAIDDAPPLITVLGHSVTWSKPCIGMVGARNASLPGRKMADMLARDLGAASYTVVSGLARGIDTAAHEGSIKTGTVAVVAGGVDNIYPPENAKLYERIKNEGAIISEHPAGLEPKAMHFPRRNRIISGMSQGIVVVEATLQSGSLITARQAAEQGRDVFAVPGSPLDPRAGGPNALIRDGAVLVEQASHITGHLTLFRGPKNLMESTHDHFSFAPQEFDETTLDQARSDILAALSPTPVPVDELVRACQVSVGIMQTVLLELELAGRIERLPGNRVSLCDEGIYISEQQRSGHR
jgi:DNA processing protein